MSCRRRRTEAAIEIQVWFGGADVLNFVGKFWRQTCGLVLFTAIGLRGGGPG